jgi:hypothetical protein
MGPPWLLRFSYGMRAISRIPATQLRYVKSTGIILLAGEAAQKKFAARSIIREKDYAADRPALAVFVDERDIPRF